MRNKNRTVAIDWILQIDWELTITLTFKKNCTEHRARKTMRRLWNGIEIQLYHKAFNKQEKRVERVCARTQQTMDKKKRLASKGTLAPVGTFGTE